MVWLSSFCLNIYIDKKTKIDSIHNLGFQIQKYRDHKHIPQLSNA